MAKRKTHCGNVRMYSMLLTNVTRSASYEALPNHRLLPAKSGLTSRFPLRKRRLWEQADETAAKAVPRRKEFLGGDQLPAAIAFGKTKCPPRRDKSGHAVGRSSWRSPLLGDPDAKFLVEN